MKTTKKRLLLGIAAAAMLCTWDITYKPGNPSESSCTTGGAYKCEKGTCPHGR